MLAIMYGRVSADVSGRRRKESSAEPARVAHLPRHLIVHR